MPIIDNNYIDEQVRKAKMDEARKHRRNKIFSFLIGLGLCLLLITTVYLFVK
jgi:hypothetical protein